jgi:type I site-specific restriction-modification system R (restriction) subunit
MSIHKEISFEDEIANHLASNGWIYNVGDGVNYDRTRALFPSDLVAWLKDTQPKSWDSLQKTHGANAETVLLDRVRKQLDDRGTLDVLRYGVEMIGLRAPLSLAQFKPALAMNAEILAKYHANRLRVVRQVRYSLHNENSIDLVLFLNGIPVATTELKTNFTQSVTDAIDQYKFDRDPKPKGKFSEPLLTFPSGALVHFAVSNSEVMMTTKLEGVSTRFLPFNKGDNGGKGNPVNPHGLICGKRSGNAKVSSKSSGATWSRNATPRRTSPQSSSRATTSWTPRGNFKQRFLARASAESFSSSIQQDQEKPIRLLGLRISSRIFMMLATRRFLTASSSSQIVT